MSKTTKIVQSGEVRGKRKEVRGERGKGIRDEG